MEGGVDVCPSGVGGKIETRWNNTRGSNKFLNFIRKITNLIPRIYPRGFHNHLHPGNNIVPSTDAGLVVSGKFLMYTTTLTDDTELTCE